MTPSGRGQEAQACSLSVDVVQRQRHAAIFFFAKWRPAPAAMELEDGPRAAGASGRDRGGDLRGRGSIAGLLRTAVGGLRRALYPLTWCSGSGTRRFWFARNASLLPPPLNLWMRL